MPQETHPPPKREEFIGESEAIMEVKRLVAAVARADATRVHIRGETGVGKDIIARAIAGHESSRRKNFPFVPFNCGASAPSELVQSELFGHKRGAFLGADEDRAGLFELAHSGTLFFDEFAEMPQGVQAKLLRVLGEAGNELKVTRMGENRVRTVDVRVISATNADLETAVAEENFRDDLYNRLIEFSIYIPPLRDRREDIPLLITHCLGIFQEEYEENITITQEAVNYLQQQQPWPGNVREIKNALKQAIIKSETKALRTEDFQNSQVQADSAPSAKLHLTEDAEAQRSMVKTFLERCGISAESIRLRREQERRLPVEDHYEQLVDTLIFVRKWEIKNQEGLRKRIAYTKNGSQYDCWTKQELRELIEVFFRPDPTDQNHPLYTDQNHPLYTVHRDSGSAHVTIAEFFKVLRAFQSGTLSPAVDD